VVGYPQPDQMPESDSPSTNGGDGCLGLAYRSEMGRGLDSGVTSAISATQLFKTGLGGGAAGVPGPVFMRARSSMAIWLVLQRLVSDLLDAVARVSDDGVLSDSRP